MGKKKLWIILSAVGALVLCCCLAFCFLGKKEKAPTEKTEDNVAPVLTLEGETKLTMGVGETVALPKAAAKDDVDGDVTEKIKKTLAHGTKLAELTDDSFTTEVGGTYKVVYSVSDESGNESLKTVEIEVAAKTPEKAMEGSNSLSVLKDSGSLFYENFEKGPENELLFDNYEDYYTLTGMENAISGNSLVIDYGAVVNSNRITLLSMLPYVQSGTWEISFDVKLVSGEGRDDFYIMYTPDVDKNVQYAHRMLLGDMKPGEVRHIEYEKVIEVLEHQEGNASFFLCNSNNICGDIVLMFDNFSMRRTDLEHTTYIPTVEELEKGFTYDWSDERYATFGKPVEVDEIEDPAIRKALQESSGFGDRAMLVTDDSVLNGILAANNPLFYQVGREYEIEINYYVADCHSASLLAVSSATQGRGIRDNVLPQRNVVDKTSLRYMIGRGEEELSLYLFGYESEVYIGNITFKLADRTDKKRNDYHTLTEKELYNGYTFDFSKNNLPKMSGPGLFIGYYDADKVAANLPGGYFKSGETAWINGMYDFNMDFLKGHLKKGRAYDLRLRFYSDLPMEMDKIFLLTKDKDGKATERNLVGLTDLGNGMYEIYTQFISDGSEDSVLLYAKGMLSMYLDSISVRMQDAKPVAKIDKGVTKNYKIDFNNEWMLFTVRNSNAGYLKEIPGGGCGLYAKIRERLHFTQLNGFTEGKLYTITLMAKHAGKYGNLVGMFEDENKNPTGEYVTPTKTTSGDIVKYQFVFTANEKTKLFALLNATPDQEEEMYITGVEVLVEEGDATSLSELTSQNGYVSNFDDKLPAMGHGQWRTEPPVGISSSQKNFYYVNLKESEDCAMDFDIFNGLVQKGYYYTLTVTGYLKDGGANVLLLPMDDKGNYAQYKASQKTLADGQTQLTYYFNGGDYFTGRPCDFLRLFNASGPTVDYELYISQIALKAVDYNSLPTGNLDQNMNKIIFPNIANVEDYKGNAQAVIIINHGKTALIDSGEKSSEVSQFQILKQLKALGVQKIDTVILTHPHPDHYGAFPLLAENFDIGAYYCKDTCWSAYEINGFGAEMEKGFDQILNAMKSKTNRDGTKVKIDTDVDFGQQIPFGYGGEFVFYYAREVFGETLEADEKREKWDGNYFSLGIRYNTKEGYDAYFAGDSAIPTNEALLLAPQFANCEIWQINHHGSNGPYTTTRQITLLDPEYAVVCGLRENLHQEVKSRIEAYGGIEIRYVGDGDLEFDLNKLKPEIEYRELSEKELYEGHTFDLSADNMPRLTSSYVDVEYMSGSGIDVKLPEGYFKNGTAIKASGQYMVNFEFLNGLIQEGRTYDIKLRVYAPEGIARSATYIEVMDELNKPQVYHKIGVTSLGNDMYDLFCQVTCEEAQKLFDLYFHVPQTYYIESIGVSMQDAKEYATFDEGIKKNYHIDFDEQWLKMEVLNTNAGYVDNVPDVGGYGLYAKINETLFFEQLKGFEKGRTYQLTFTTHHSGIFGEIWGIFYDSKYKQTSKAFVPMKTVDNDTVTYTFIFTADETTQMFGLFNNNRNVEEEMYIQSVAIQSYMLDSIMEEEIHTNGYNSDFSSVRFDFDFAGCRDHYWELKEDTPVLHVKQVAGSTTSLRFQSFYGLFRENKVYRLRLDVNQLKAGDMRLLPLNAEGAQINGMTYRVEKTSAAATGEMSYIVTFAAPKGLHGLNLYCIGGTNEIEIRSVSLEAYGAVSSEEVHSAGYTSDLASDHLLFGGSAQASYEVKNQETVLHVKQEAGKTPGLRFDSFLGVFKEGYLYQLKLKVNELSEGTLYVLPLNDTYAQINGLQYNVERSARGADGQRTYTVTFTAPKGLQDLYLYCVGGTNEMEIKSISLAAYRVVSGDMIHKNCYKSDFAKEKLYFGGNAEVKYEEKGSMPVLHVKQEAGKTPGLRFDSFAGAFQEGATYYLRLKVNQLSKGTLVLLPLNANNAQINGQQYSVIKSSVDATGEMIYTISFTAPVGLHNLNLYCIGGTNEMEVQQIELQGIASSALEGGVTVKPGECAFKYSGGKTVAFEEAAGETLLHLTIGEGMRSFNLDSFNGKIIQGRTYQLTIEAAEDNNPAVSGMLVLPMSADGRQVNGAAYGMARTPMPGGGVTYTCKFSAPKDLYQLRLYYTLALLDTKIKSVTLRQIP